MHLYTIGYEGEQITSWIKKLKQAGITVLIDIREKAISRKKGFSKTALQKELQANDIAYLHFRNLGSPSKIRKKLMEDKDYESFFQKYNEHLDEQENTLRELVSLLEHEKACLMCFEKNHQQCHRSAVVKRLEKIYPGNVRVEHL